MLPTRGVKKEHKKKGLECVGGTKRPSSGYIVTNTRSNWSLPVESRSREDDY